MKRKFIFCLGLIFYLLPLAMVSQYVTLQGRQFKDENGNDFYPVIMNYGVYIQKHNSDFFPAPEPGYGSDPNGFEHSNRNQCINDIYNDFTTCKELGFNCVRIVGGLCPFFFGTPHSPGIDEVFLCPPTNYVVVPAIYPTYTGVAFLSLEFGQQAYKKFVLMGPTNQNDQITDDFISYISAVLDIANSVGIKVILLTARGDMFLQNAAFGNAVDVYAVYLRKLADAVKNKPALLAYDLINEPGDDGQHIGNSNLTKLEICTITKEWFDAIKAKDSNHLITMGTGDIYDIKKWDPGILKLDFVSPHIYPYEKKFMTDNTIISAPGYSRTDAYKGWQAHIFWLSQNLPLPWLIGETGFSSNDNISGLNCTNCSSLSNCNVGSCDPNDQCVYNKPPYQFGCESEQATFALNSQKYVWDCGGSGYSWWAFQESGDGNFNANDTADVCSKFWGLLKRGYDFPYTNAEKPASTVFRNTDKPNYHPRVGMIPPSNYGNEFNGIYNPVSVNILDQNGNIVTDAVLFGGNNADVCLDAFQTYTIFNSSSGHYTLHNFFNTHLNPSDKFTDISTSACGASNAGGGASLTSLSIIRNNLDYDFTVDTGEITSGPVSFNCMNRLFVTNTQIDGGVTADFFSRNEVHITPESGDFEAQQGSEIHVFLQEILPDCSMLDGANNGISSYRLSNTSKNQKSIELSFGMSKACFIVYPNPNSGIFNISNVIQNNPQNIELEITVFDLVGQQVYSKKFSSIPLAIDISSLGRGAYFVKINDSSNITFKKIIYE